MEKYGHPHIFSPVLHEWWTPWVFLKESGERGVVEPLIPQPYRLSLCAKQAFAGTINQLHFIFFIHTQIFFLIFRVWVSPSHLNSHLVCLLMRGCGSNAFKLSFDRVNLNCRVHEIRAHTSGLTTWPTWETMNTSSSVNALSLLNHRYMYPGSYV